MNPESIIQIQKQLGLPQTGVFDTNTMNAMNNAVTQAVAKNPTISQMTQADPTAISNAYMTGDWSNVMTPTGTPFSKKQQREAFTQAERALAPGFKAQATYDTANIEDTLKNQQDEFGRFIRDEGEQFEKDKIGLDQSAADQGILFSGSRVQKNRDLRNTYETRQADAADLTGRNIANTARDYQYNYGNQNANKLSQYYNLPTANTYNPNVATGGVKTSMNLSSVYNPSKYKFQGTIPTSQKAQTQVRASGLLANRANKLLGKY